MKRILTVLAAVLVVGLGAGKASAQYPPQSMPMAPGGYPGAGPDAAMQYGGPQAGPPQGGAGDPAEAAVYQKRYGFHPFFSRFHRGTSGGCNTCGKSGKHASAPVYAQPPANLATGGTLAFPHHQFVRSPRDYFMAD